MNEANKKPYRKKAATNVFAEHGKIPPQAIELEEAVLGALMLEKDCLEMVEHILLPEVFYKETHQKIYFAIKTLYDKKEPYDILLTTNELKRTGELENVGGPYHISQLINRIVSGANIVYHSRVIKQKYYRRELIRFSTECIKDAFDDTVDVFKALEKLKEGLETIDSLGGEKVNIETMRDISVRTIDEIMVLADNNVNAYYKTGSNLLDKHLKITPNNSLLFGGKSGAGKTRFVVFIISLLLRQHDDISVLWYTMEDDIRKMLRCFISQDVKLSDEELLGINYKHTEDDKNAIMALHNTFNDYDVEFCDDANSMKNIGQHFRKFCKVREGRFCFLIIDNLMGLDDQNEKKQQTAIDDQIARQIIKLRKDTNKKGNKSFIISLHHFTEEQQKELNLKEGYRPRENHFKGSTRHRDANTIVMLMNKPAFFKDLVAQYKGYEDILESLFLIEITKHRDGKMYNDNVMRFFGTLDYNIFIDI